MKKDTPNNRNTQINRREFSFNTAATILAGALGSNFLADGAAAATSSLDVITETIPLGFDNFSIRAHEWKADKLIEFAAEQKLDSLLLSDLDVFENHESKYLNGLKAKADDAGLLLHAGTGSICPTAKRWNDKWGTAEEHLKLGIRIAKELGSPVFRSYLGGQDERQTDGGIQKHIETTVKPGLFTKKCFEEEPIAYGPVFRKVKRTIIRMGHDTQWVKLRITSSSQNSIAASKSKAAINV